MLTLFILLQIRSWEMKVLKKGCVRKLAAKRDPFYKWIAGGPRPQVTQRCLEKSQSQERNTSSPNHGHWSRKDVASLESSCGCCHGDQMMYLCICAFKHVFSHELVLNSNSILQIQRPHFFSVWEVSALWGYPQGPGGAPCKIWLWSIQWFGSSGPVEHSFKYSRIQI